MTSSGGFSRAGSAGVVASVEASAGPALRAGWPLLEVSTGPAVLEASPGRHRGRGGLCGGFLRAGPGALVASNGGFPQAGPGALVASAEASTGPAVLEGRQC